MFVDVGHAQYLNGNLRPTNFSCIFGKGAIQLTSTSIPVGLVEITTRVTPASRYKSNCMLYLILYGNN